MSSSNKSGVPAGYAESYPVEVLLYIFRLVCSSYFDLGSNTTYLCDYTSSDSRPRIRFVAGLTTLSLVCSTWRHILITCPSFWTSLIVTPRTPPPALATWDGRMREAPIRLRVVLQPQLRPDRINVDLVHFDAMCSFIVRKAPQCRELCVYASDHPILKTFCDLLHRPVFSILDNLSIVLLENYAHGRLHRAPVLNRVTPSTFAAAKTLAQLRLSGFTLDWTSVAPYHGLTTLLLHRIDRASAPTLSELQRLFKSAERLSRLSISEVHCTGSLEDRHPISLRSLRSLHLHISRKAPIAPLLSLLRAPLLRQVDLSAAPGADELAGEELGILLECAPMMASVTHLGLKGYYFPWQGAAMLEQLMPLIIHLNLGCGAHSLSYTLRYSRPCWPALRFLVVRDAAFDDVLTVCEKYSLARLKVCNIGRLELTAQQQSTLRTLVDEVVTDHSWPVKWFLRDEE
ncbi:hypothetical protein K438DRAFT_1749351 [Mycena galopus ATCC 62051]|nr:hypothetical protein K438DRAFT_1749351 [Mycena galopus ATCC 62051]